MIITSTDGIPGKQIKETIGIVKGNTIRAKHIGRDIMAGFKQIIGGEIKSYTTMFIEAREQAISRMEEEAKKLNADAIVAVRMATAQIMPGAAEIMCYGTAVKLK